MSRIGKLPIQIPEGVELNINKQVISVKGKLGQLKHEFNNHVKVVFEEGKVQVSATDPDDKKSRAMWGLTRSLIANMVTGVTEGFKRTLEVNGVGYRAAVNGNMLSLFLGYSHDINFLIPHDIEIKCPKPTVIEIFGYDKHRVGHIASKIRSLRPPEPYKGKGVKYDNEVIFRKEGKKK